MIERRQTLELKKHVAAIHSTNKLTLLQRKIANALLFNAYDDLLGKEEHEIHISALCKLIGYDSNDHKTIKRALVNLLATVIEWNLVDGDRLDAEGVWNASSIIADASIDGALCTYSYSNKMKRLLHRPELYGRLNMLVQAQFQSSYGLALYENCVRFQNIEQTPWFDMIQFRKLMGVEEKKYKIFRDFKHRVIDKAVEEVNQYASIHVLPQFQRNGRQVVAIQFRIQPSKPNSHHDATQQSVMEMLKLRFGLSAKQAKDVIMGYEEEYILQKIAVIESSTSFIQGKINHLANYLLRALKEDYQPAKSSVRIPVREQYDEKQKIERNRAERYYRYQNKQILKLFNEQSDVNRQSMQKEFENQLGNGIYYDLYNRDGIKNVLIQDQLCSFIRQKKVDFMKSIPSFSDFCSESQATE